MPEPSPDAVEPRWTPALVSVVIPAYNCAEVIDVQLHALAGQDYTGAWEIVVADNRSTDGTAAAAMAWSDRLPAPIRVVDASERQGVSHARNTGVAAATGDLIAICDADDRAEPTWLSAIVDAAGHLDLVGGWLDPEPLNDPMARAWREVLPRDELPIAENWLPFAMGANVAFRRSCFDEIGGFREDYARGGDDVEFSWRAVRHGFRLGPAPDAVIAYRFRDSLEALWRQYEGYGAASPRLYRDHRQYGMPRPSLHEAVTGYRRLLVDAPAARRDPVRKGEWVRRAAYRWGKLKGSFRHKVVYL